MNNKGFAISTTMYIILVLSLILIIATLSILNSRKMTLDKIKDTTLSDIKTNLKTDANSHKYYVNNIVKYKNKDYYIIGDQEDYVITLKSEPLTFDEISQYHSDIINQDGYGYLNFHSDTYEASNIKSVLDAWTQDNINMNDLKEINGYKYRLFNINDKTYTDRLINHPPVPGYYQSLYDRIYSNNYAYFTMINTDSQIHVINNDTNIISASKDDKYAIRPVLNIYKNRLDDINE